MDGINEDNGPVFYYARGQYEVNWLDDDNKKENEKRRSVRGDIKNKKEAGCDYTSEWVDWLNENEDSPWSKDPSEKKTTKLTFKEKDGLTVHIIEDRVLFTLSPDFADRGNRPSVKFNECLEAFAEKTYDRDQKMAFFKENSVGEKWSSLETLKSLEPWVKVARDTIKIRGKFSLNDKSVKNYPIRTFEIFEEVFFKELKSKEKDISKRFKLSAEAQEFVPGARVLWGSKNESSPLLQRCGPPKRWGCYLVEQDKPKKKPLPNRRPRTSSKNSTQHVSWQHKDHVFQELNEKMDKIIHGLETPVVHAQRVVQAPNYGIW